MKEDFFAFVAGFKTLTGMDLGGYNQAQVVRRLEPLLERNNLPTFAALLKSMEEDHTIIKEAMNRLTIHYSGFFRDPQFWTTLHPLVFDLAAKTGFIQAWSAGCGNGEEAWTLAFFLEGILPRGNYQVLASDIDQEALETASTGLYSRVKGIPSKDLYRYFTPSAGSFRIREHYRKRIQFKRHDLIRDSYPSKLNLILCRNVMIYFRQSVKDSIGAKMYEALTAGGLLCLGGTEHLATGFFVPGDNNIYTK